MASGIPQDSTLGLVLFNIFIHYLDKDVEGTLRQFEDQTKLDRHVDLQDSRKVLRRDQNRLEQWVEANGMRVSKAKCWGHNPREAPTGKAPGCAACHEVEHEPAGGLEGQ